MATETGHDKPEITVRVAGVARGNPGLAGAGIEILTTPRAAPEKIAKYLGGATALEAQLQALRLALQYVRPLAPAPLHLVLANETAARQLSGQQPARHPEVVDALAELQDLLAAFDEVRLSHGHPDELAEVERLANLAIDTRLRPLPAYDRPLPR